MWRNIGFSWDSGQSCLLVIVAVIIALTLAGAAIF